MAETGKRRYALADFSVELRRRSWYFGRQYDPPGKFRGPYKSIASVTLMIARQLRHEVERRDAALVKRPAVPLKDESIAPF